VIPGLIDGHLHVIRQGLHFNLELRWDGVRSLKQGLDMIREQANRTPEGQWIRVVGGWVEHQFEEKRLPTLAELDEAGHGRPVFVLHLYDCALVNRVGLGLLGYSASTPNPPSGEIVRDGSGNPTGVLIARPNAFLLYNTLNMLPKMSFEQQLSSTLAYQYELHRFGLTSALDPGGGFQNYPTDYKVVQELDKKGQLSLRIAYSLFPQKAGSELADFKKWAEIVKPGDGTPNLRMVNTEQAQQMQLAQLWGNQQRWARCMHDR
jgi:predicted amidohydrolase YtcJ